MDWINQLDALSSAASYGHPCDPEGYERLRDVLLEAATFLRSLDRFNEASEERSEIERAARIREARNQARAALHLGEDG
jgi:hypothetical protein